MSRYPDIEAVNGENEEREKDPITQDFASYLKYELNRSPLTIQAYSHDLMQFADWITGSKTEELDVSDITLSDIRSWLASLARQNETAVTIRRKAQSLRAFFRYLVKSKKLSVNPTADLVLPKVPKKLPDVLRVEDVENVVGQLRSEVQDSSEEDDRQNWRALFDLVVIETLYTLGIRRAELIAIDDSDIWEDAGEIKIFGKRSKTRVVPMAQELMGLLRRWQRMRDSLWGPTPDSRALFAINGKRVTPTQVYNSVRRSLASVTASKKSPHALRHSFATGMLNEGADLNSVKEFLGHSSLATTQIYTHVSFAEMKKAYRDAHPRSVNRTIHRDEAEEREEDVAEQP